jgi:RNA-directed DNA polymerase
MDQPHRVGMDELLRAVLPVGALYPLLRRINAYLVRWMRKKYKRLRTFTKAHAAWRRTTRQYPRYFAHWRWVPEF